MKFRLPTKLAGLLFVSTAVAGCALLGVESSEVDQGGPCSESAQCPNDTQCVAGLCRRQIKVGAIYLGSEADTYSQQFHAQLVEADTKLGYVSLQEAYLVTLGAPEEGSTLVSTDQQVDEWVTDGAEIIVFNSQAYEGDVQRLANKYPKTKFIIPGSSATRTTNIEHAASSQSVAWYLAGVAVGTVPGVERVGIVGATPIPEAIRNINAFTLGARNTQRNMGVPEDHLVRVELRWLGYYNDVGAGPIKECDRGNGVFVPCTIEEYLASKFKAANVSAIAHQGDGTQLQHYIWAVLNKIPNSQPIWVVPNHVERGCENISEICIGSVYHQFSPLFLQSFEAVQNGTWPPAAIEYSAEGTSELGKFKENQLFGQIDQTILNSARENLAVAGVQGVFQGPYETNDRDLDGDGVGDSVEADQPLTAKEIENMCWFVKGVVYKKDQSQPRNDTLDDIDASVPKGTDKTHYPDAINPFSLPEDIWFNCEANTSE